ncbi:MAG: hypothetical protein EAX96_06095 [Candidatus Lokiarchaeota archaeon]|nr:hypothetical protein [Candidatus Lokiarchaeota archaeon]
MPFINRIRFVNIGVKRSFMTDLTLDFHEGASTVIFAKNGTGKSIIIGLTLALIRPSAAEFIKGTEDEPRKFSDYISSKNPSHVIIEWNHNRENIKEFLVTGMIISKKQSDDIKRDFYSFRYSPESPNHINFTTLPIFENDSLTTHKDFIKSLRRMKEQQTQVFNTINRWLDNLKSNQIDPELIKNQILMNQTEGGQDQLLYFKTDFDFIQFLIKNIMTIKDDENFEEIKNAYRQLRQVPEKQAEKDFIERLLNKLENGIEIEKSAKAIEEALENNSSIWKGMKLLGVQLKNNFNNEKISTEDSLNKLREELDNLTIRIENIKNEIAFLKYNKNRINIAQLRRKQTIASNKKDEFTKLKNVYEILMPFRNKQELMDKIQALNAMRDEKTRPLRENLEQKRQIVLYYCRDQSKELEKQKNRIERLLTEIRENISKNNVKSGELKQALRSLKNDFKSISTQLEEIEEKRKGLLEYFIAGYDLEGTISHYGYEIEEKRQELISLDENYKKLNQENYRKYTEKSVIKDKFSKVEIEKDKLERELLNSLADWNDIISDTYFCSYFGEIENKNEVNYNILNDENKHKLEIELNKITELLFDNNLRKRSFDQQVTYFDEKMMFPFNIEINLIKKILKDKGIEGWIGAGWEYLSKYITDPDGRDDFANKIPHLLDDIVVIHSNISEIKNILNGLRENGDLNHLERPVFISSPSIFEKIPSQIDDKDFFLLQPGLKWRYEEEEASDRYDKLKTNRSILNEEITKTKTIESRLINLINKWNNYLEKNPHELHRDRLKRLKDIKIEVTEFQKEIQAIDSQIETNQLNMNDMEKKQKYLSNLIKEKEEILKKLEIFFEIYKNQSNLEEKKANILKEQQIKREDLDKVEADIDELNKRYHNKKIEIEEIISKEKEIEYKIRECDTSPLENIKLSENQLKNYSKEKNLDAWWNIYISIKTEYDNYRPKNELEAKIKDLELDLKKVTTNLNLQAKALKLDLEEPILISLAKQDVNEIEVTNKKEELIEKINDLSTVNRDLLKDIKKLSDESDKLEEMFHIKETDLKEVYSGILENELDLNDQISNLEEEEAFKEKEKNLTEENIAIFEKQVKELGINIELLKNKLDIIDAKLQLLGQQLNEQLIKIPVKEIEIKTFTEFNENFDNLVTQTNNNIKEKESIEKKIQDFIHQIRGLNKFKDDRIKNKELFKFVDTFDKVQVFNTSFFIERLGMNLKQLQAQIYAPEGRLQNIVIKYSTKVDEIIKMIKKIEEERFDIEELEHLKNKPILRIPIKNRNINSIKDAAKRYFNNLFYQNESFPENISNEIIINEIIREFLEDKLSPITFLFPEDSTDVSYERIKELKIGSGGEKLTMAILLYCLIAHFRMFFELGGSKEEYSFPLIMDDPLGDANRPDLIAMVASMAEKLQIQLIPFTPHEEIEALHYFKNTITMKKDKIMDGRQIIEIDPETSKNIIQAGSILRKTTLNKEIDNVN